MGDIAEDIILAGGDVLNVYSGELLRMNVTLRGERIFYVGLDPNPSADNNTKIIDVSGKILVPGYIDPHFHPWFIYNPVTFSMRAAPLGITTLICDNLIFYMIMGVDLFEKFMEAMASMPIKIFWSCRVVPQTPMQEEEELYSLLNLKRLLRNPLVKSLGEITRWPHVIKEDPKIIEMIRFTKTLKKRVDGHTAGAKKNQISLLSGAGVESCHEAINSEEALERLRAGMYVILRESSLRQDLSELLNIVTERRVLTDRLMITTDSSSPGYYHKYGVMDYLLKIALNKGIEPVLAYKMATINPAVYFGMDHEIGGIAPGRYADIVVLNDIMNPTPEMVISKGQILARDGELISSFPGMDWSAFFPMESFYKPDWKAEKSLFKIKIKDARIRFPVINLISPVITKLEWEKFNIKDGFLCLNEDYQYIALVNREGRWITNGILKGFAQVDGLASSFNTAAQILTIGRDPDAMSTAVNRVMEIRGGIVAVQKRRIVYEFSLPLGGIMSPKPIGEIAKKEDELKSLLKLCGYRFHDPLYTLIFLPNDFLPEVRINYRGVINIKKDEVLWPRTDMHQ